MGRRVGNTMEENALMVERAGDVMAQERGIKESTERGIKESAEIMVCQTIIILQLNP